MLTYSEVEDIKSSGKKNSFYGVPIKTMLLHYVDAHYVNVNIRVCYYT